MDEIEKNDRYITKIGKWLVFNRNTNYYMMVNSELNNYQLTTETLKNQYYDMTDPMYWYLEKETGKTYREIQFEGVNDVINDLFKYEKSKSNDKGDIDEFADKTEPIEKKVKGFWDFLKKKK